jgi:hypothetical protein
MKKLWNFLKLTFIFCIYRFPKRIQKIKFVIFNIDNQIKILILKLIYRVTHLKVHNSRWKDDTFLQI